MALNLTYPKISILTPIYNRNEYLPLMIFNLQGFIYPDKHLLEWVIDDDGTDPLFKNPAEIEIVAMEIKPITINYTHNNKKRSIGEKRNHMVKRLANFKHMAMMDSDDIYLPSYLQYSIEIMKTKQHSLVGSNQMIFVYPYKKWTITAIRCEAKRQIHEATMVFTKRHWQSMGGFVKSSQGEGAGMIDFNDNKCGITDIQYLMICVCHKTNTIKKDQFLREDGSNTIDGKLSEKVKNIINDCIQVD